MPATAQGLELIDRSVVGQTEHPPNSNHIFVWKDLIAAGLASKEMDGQPYCAGGIVWTDWKAGAPILPVQSPFYVPSRIQYARAHGLWDADGRYQPGDEVCFAWTPSAIAAGLGEHIERVLADDGKIITTIGFNTSPERLPGGSQANGDGVWLRHRPHGPTVLGAVKYSTLLGKSKPPANPVKINPWRDALRTTGPLSLHPHDNTRSDAIRAVQWAVGVPVDGQFGALTDHGVRVFQRFHVDQHGRRLTSDGVVGGLTRWALLQITHHQHKAA